MSSRLLTMKFMQRAAASATSSPATTLDNRPTKRQRLSEGHNYSPSPSPATNNSVVRDALAEEEAKRQDAIDREAARRGDSKWYLDVQPLSTGVSQPPVRIISTGFSSLDESLPVPKGNDTDESDEPEPNISQQGRRTFGKPVVKPKKPHEDEDEISGESEGDDNDDTNDSANTIKRQKSTEDLRAKLKGKRRADAVDNADRAGERRSKQVKLNKLTSISSAGRSASAVTCHACGQKGHVKAQCTNVRRHSRKTL